jgi:hypothetical protein
MKRKRNAFLGLTALNGVVLTQSGCLDISLREAVSAGVFDFVAGTIAAVLTGLLPFQIG